MKTFWLILAGVCGATALFFVLRDEFDRAFIAAAAGAVAWFLNYRVQLRQSLDLADEQEQREEDMDSGDE